MIIYHVQAKCGPHDFFYKNEGYYLRHEAAFAKSNELVDAIAEENGITTKQVLEQHLVIITDIQVQE